METANSLLNEGFVEWSDQLPLLAPAITPGAMLSVSHPYPGIGMALVMVAPEHEKGTSPDMRRVRLLAVSPDGHFMAKISAKFYSVSAEDLDHFWKHSASLLACARKQSLPVPKHWCLDIPFDSLQSLININSWEFSCNSNSELAITSLFRRSLGMETSVDNRDQTVGDRHIQEQLSRRFSDCILTFLQRSLDPSLFSLLMARPQLGFSTLHKLMTFAKANRRNAWRYMQNAIRTESLSILDLVARDEGRAVREAIFAGKSLPKLLKEDYGIDGGVHRRTLVRPPVLNQFGAENSVLANLPLSSSSFFASLPLLKMLPFERWPTSRTRWQDFFNLASELHNLEIDLEFKKSLLCWVMNNKMKHPSYALFRFLAYCETLCSVAKNLAGINLDQRDARAFVVGFMESNGYQCPDEVLNTEAVGATVTLVASISGIDINTLCGELFALTPPLPDDFDCMRHYVITPLSSLFVCMEHGLATSQCLKTPETAIKYAARCALYGVRFWTSGVPLGTIACEYDTSDASAPKVVVSEFNGVHNQRTASLAAIASSLAVSFSRPEHLVNFVIHSEATTKFRKLAGARG